MKYLLILIACLSLNCNSQIVSSQIGDFDISTDDKKILFSYSNQNESSIYELSVDNNLTKCLIQTKGKTSYYNPAYSFDGSKIVFIKNNSKSSLKNSLCIANSDGTHIKCLYQTNETITETFFSRSSDEIVFSTAKSYSNYSPIGVKASHDFDIYTININDERLKQITHLNAYLINNISEIDSTKLIFSLIADSKDGIVVFDRTKNTFSFFIPSNNPRKDKSLYYAPSSSIKSGAIVFAAPYEIYRMESLNSIAKLVTRVDTNPSKIKFFKTKDNILFTEENSLSFFIFDFSKKELSEHPINMIK